MEDTIQKWIIKWFLNQTDADEEDMLTNLEKDYFRAGWIDSFKFISFISDIEEKFNIVFTNDEFQNREFSRINGLSQIIKEKIKDEI